MHVWGSHAARAVSCPPKGNDRAPGGRAPHRSRLPPCLCGAGAPRRRSRAGGRERSTVIQSSFPRTREPGSSPLASNLDPRFRGDDGCRPHSPARDETVVRPRSSTTARPAVVPHRSRLPPCLCGAGAPRRRSRAGGRERSAVIQSSFPRTRKPGSSPLASNLDPRFRGDDGCCPRSPARDETVVRPPSSTTARPAVVPHSKRSQGSVRERC